MCGAEDGSARGRDERHWGESRAVMSGELTAGAAKHKVTAVTETDESSFASGPGGLSLRQRRRN